MESRITYFEDWRPENTEKTFEIVKERLLTSEIKKIVIASTTGETALKAALFFKDDGVKLVVVPHQHGFHRAKNVFPKDLVISLRAEGHAVHFGTMLFHTDGLYGSSAPTAIANILRCFCQGVKVCFEIVLMAADAGLVEPGERVIAIAGTARGSDTALVMQAASTQQIRGLRVNEILCKPLNPMNLDELREKLEKGKP